LNDGDEVGRGTNPLDADSDDDGLNDGTEVQVGTNPLDPDSDDDGIPDGRDVEWLQQAVRSLPRSAWRDRGLLLPRETVEELDEVEFLVRTHFDHLAVLELKVLRHRMDGCGQRPQLDDWIVDCSAQLQIRSLVDLLITNLGG